MINVYIDPTSYVHLNNVFFREDSKYSTNNSNGPFIFLKKYCRERDINLNTIDLWNPVAANSKDIYVSFDHKFLLRKIYWKLKNRNYPIINPKRFKKKILFHFEPPVVIPEIRYMYKKIMKIYDKVFFTWGTGIPQIRHFHTPLPILGNGVFPDYWANTNRRFLTLINSNRRLFSYYKELLTERIRAIIFFSQTNDIDLYGRDWEKLPLFPYWFHKNTIKRVYKGILEDKYKKLSEYNFAFAFENCALPGYITDKIFDCFYVGTIPIYLGDPDVEKYIPKNCFIDMRDFKNYEELKRFLKSLTESEIKKYKENARLFLESERVELFTKEYFANIFIEACTNKD